MKKRTKVFVLVAMMLLLGVTGYLNLTLNNRIVDAQGQSTINYFTQFAEKREQTRQTEFLYYEAIINSEASTQEQKVEAHEKKMEIISNMESEFAMEEQIRAKGFNECAVTYSNSYINVIIKGQLAREQVAQVVSIVKQQTNLHSDYITITQV